MVKHIVFWKLKDEYQADAEKIAQELREHFQRMLGQADGMLAIEVGPNYNGGNFDLALYAEFTTKEAQDAYQVFPPHMEMKKRVHELVCARECIDYEL